MRHQGKITTWKDEQGFGFITPNGGGNKIFVHIKSFENRQRRPVGNEIVTYELKNDEKGRGLAENVTFVGESKSSASASRRSNFPIILALVFLVIVTGLFFSGKLPVSVLGLYLVASAVTFVAYALDKSAAKNDQRRTPEKTLHLFALVGGWPGALVAQRLLRHKSKKQSFQIVFWATVVLNCGALGWLFLSSDAELLRSMLGAA
jgi:uncharacterized membrane protein YsdA (DUF1294 family)/cold shock CspA family protein